MLHAVLLATPLVACPQDVASGATPNVVILLADDLGPGEVGHGGGVVPTPHIDRLATEGMCFTDGHSTSSVCTPSRYSLLTGRYAWRTRLKSGVFIDATSKPLIDEERSTIADLCKERGYRTAVVGKWHLGLGWALVPGDEVPEELAGGNTHGSWRIDYREPFTGGPLALGFDEFFGVCSSLDVPPFLWCEGERAAGIPTGNKTWGRTGAATEAFEADEALARLAARSVHFIHEAAGDEVPFLLYLPLTSPHTPIVPGKAFRGRTEWGDYADFLVETDHVVGEVLDALDESGVAGDTFVLLSSDNGFAPYVKIPELRAAGQRPSGPYRGAKADIYEGGHRVPFLVRFPDRVEAGSSTDRIASLVDVYATLVELFGARPDAARGEDSISFLPTLLGEAQEPRPHLVHHSINGSFAIRQGRWKLCLCPGSGGWSAPRPKKARERAGAEIDPWPEVQLFDLSADVAETNNLADEYPEVVRRLTELLESIRGESD